MIFSGGSIAEGLSMYRKVPLCKIWRFLHKVHDFPQILINMHISVGLYMRHRAGQRSLGVDQDGRQKKLKK